MTSQRNALSTFQQDSGHSRKLRAQSASPGAGNSVSAVRVACRRFAGSLARVNAVGSSAKSPQAAQQAGAGGADTPAARARTTAYETGDGARLKPECSSDGVLGGTLHRNNVRPPWV